MTKSLSLLVVLYSAAVKQCQKTEFQTHFNQPTVGGKQFGKGDNMSDGRCSESVERSQWKNNIMTGNK